MTKKSRKFIEGSKKSLEIANICYANVSGLFAMFTNSNSRGPNFTWEWFIEHCEEQAGGWMYLNNVKGDKETVNDTARRYAKEIATNLVRWTRE